MGDATATRSEIEAPLEADERPHPPSGVRRASPRRPHELDVEGDDELPPVLFAPLAPRGSAHLAPAHASSTVLAGAESPRGPLGDDAEHDGALATAPPERSVRGRGWTYGCVLSIAIAGGVELEHRGQLDLPSADAMRHHVIEVVARMSRGVRTRADVVPQDERASHHPR